MIILMKMYFIRYRSTYLVITEILKSICIFIACKKARQKCLTNISRGNLYSNKYKICYLEAKKVKFPYVYAARAEDSKCLNCCLLDRIHCKTVCWEFCQLPDLKQNLLLRNTPRTYPHLEITFTQNRCQYCRIFVTTT